MKTILDFNCPRTCPRFERRDLCRFNAIFAKLGSVAVNSHTTRVKVDIKNPVLFGEIAARSGARVIGNGTHALYERGAVPGYAVHLNGWRYPVVIERAGGIALDTYEGRWGNESYLALIIDEYTLETARVAAENEGWQAQIENGLLTVFHPSGGILTVGKGGTIEASQFTGTACHEAGEKLRVALGPALETQYKPEYGQIEVQQHTD